MIEQLLKQCHQKQADLARALDLSKAANHRLVKTGEAPARADLDTLRCKVKSFFVGHGIDESTAAAATATVCKPEKPIQHKTKQTQQESIIMLLAKQRLNQQARQHFGLSQDPFGEVRHADDVYLTPDARYVRESMRQVAQHGGFMAVVGESGSGKSTLRRDFIGWAAQQNQPITIIQPYVLGMEDNDIKGKTLKTGHIAEAILSEIAPAQTIKRSAEVRFRQLHNALLESHRAGNRHVLIIEEAHSLPIPTLKHLKRLLELEADDGFSSLISVILIGQTELGRRLDERNPQVREVVQRCEVVKLRPLNSHLPMYLKHRFERTGKPLDAVLDDGCVDALHNKLMGNTTRSALLPLAVHNVVAAAMNQAAAIGSPTITPDIIAEV